MATALSGQGLQHNVLGRMPTQSRRHGTPARSIHWRGDGGGFGDGSAAGWQASAAGFF
jgi:hypothetical protein